MSTFPWGISFMVFVLLAFTTYGIFTILMIDD